MGSPDTPTPGTPETPRAWVRVERCHPAGRALADRHYPRQTPGARDFAPPGRNLTLCTPLGDAVWCVVENLDPVGNRRWRCSIFRNEGSTRSSELVREATETTLRFWRRNYGAWPLVPLTTEIDPIKTRRKRDPGRCFLRAGWRHLEWRNGLRVLVEPLSGLLFAAMAIVCWLAALVGVTTVAEERAA